VIGCELDPHSHLSPAMHDNAILMCYRENPHIDISLRGRELVDLLLRTARREVQPVTSVFNCRMADVFQTQREPMKGFVARMRAMEGCDGVLSISIVHGFRRADIPLLGTQVIVITDDNASRGAELAERLGRELFEMRGQCADPTQPMDEAVATALAWDAATLGPLVLAEMADNPGGGSPGDATYVLKALIDAGIDRIAAGVFIDPLAVRCAIDAGLGARLTMRVGGKACPLSGPPLDLEVTVTAIDPAAKIVIGGDTIVPMGRAVALRFANGELLLAENRNQTYGPSIFADLGIDLRCQRVILVKSAQHFKAHFADITQHSLTLDSPGVCVADVTKLPFKRLTRPLWPWDENPWS
jgi:microcystin degradation protein MlrC